MSTRKFTPWFTSHYKPVRNGVYQTHLGSWEGYSRWKRGRWSNQKETAQAAAELPPSDCGIQTKSWRGLIKGNAT